MVTNNQYIEPENFFISIYSLKKIEIIFTGNNMANARK